MRSVNVLPSSSPNLALPLSRFPPDNGPGSAGSRGGEVEGDVQPGPRGWEQDVPLHAGAMHALSYGQVSLRST